MCGAIGLRKSARSFLELGHEEDSSISWLVEDPHRSTADLMIGGAGVAHFLLRMCHDNISAPLLLPAACTEKLDPDVLVMKSAEGGM